MKKIFQNNFLTAVAVLFLFAACNKDVTYLANPVSSDNNAFVKIVHASPNFATVWGYADNINVYNAQSTTVAKINGTTLAYDKYFPTTTNPYFAIAAGRQDFKFCIGGVFLADSINFYNASADLTAGGHYTYVVTDNLKTSGGILLSDAIPALDTKTYGLRFVHAITNDTAGKTIDIFSTRNNAVIFTGQAAVSSTDFLTLNYTTTSDTLIVRRAGTTFELARVNGFVPTPGRSYTMLYRGNGAVTLSTGKPRGVIMYAN